MEEHEILKAKKCRASGKGDIPLQFWVVLVKIMLDQLMFNKYFRDRPDLKKKKKAFGSTNIIVWPETH